MDLEEERRKRREEQRDAQDAENTQKTGENATKKIKNPFKMMLRNFIITVLVPLLLKILIIAVIIGALTAALAWLFNFVSSSRLSDVASERVIKEEVEIKKKSDEEGYYFEISQDILDKYIDELNKGYIQGYYDMYMKEESEVKSRDEANALYDPNDKAFDNEYLRSFYASKEFQEYFVRMIRAEIAGSYPKLGDYKGDKVYSYDKNEKGETKNPTDNNGNYVAQGVVKIHRIKMNKDTSTQPEIELKYLPYDEFQELLAECNATGRGTILNYFSFEPEKKILYYATYQEQIVTVNGEEVSRSLIYKVDEYPYEAVIQMCAMPFNFLWALLEASEDPEWIMAVINLLLEETDVVLMIQDSLTITEDTQITERARNTVTTVTDSSGNITTTNNLEFPIEGSTTETVITTYTNTATVFIKKAKTWWMDLEQKVDLQVSESESEQTYDYPNIEDEMTLISSDTTEVPDDSSSNTIQSSGVTSSNTNETSGATSSNTTESSGATSSITTEVYESGELVTYKKKHETVYYWKVSIIEKKINHERFLGTWKNDTGEYYPGSLYKADGKDVKYEMPKSSVKTSIPPEAISDESNQNIHLLILILSKHGDTETATELMKYFWNIYKDTAIYDVDLDKLTNLFDENVQSTTTGNNFVGSNWKEKIWWALIDAGYSEYATAGAMGNIQAESGFIPNAANGVGDYAQYTADIDNGVISSEEVGNHAYGFAQWLGDRARRLYDYTKMKNVSISDGNRQIEYLISEMSEYGVGPASGYGMPNFLGAPGNDGNGNIVYYNRDNFVNAQSPEEAARVYCFTFERPGNGNYDTSQRENNARNIYNEFHGTERPVADGQEVIDFSRQYLGKTSKDIPGLCSWAGIDASTPWCAAFVRWAFHSVGYELPLGYNGNGVNNGAGSFKQWAEPRGKWHTMAEVQNGTYTPKPGDIYLLKPTIAGAIASHVGIVSSYNGSILGMLSGNSGSNYLVTDVTTSITWNQLLRNS